MQKNLENLAIFIMEKISKVNNVKITNQLQNIVNCRKNIEAWLISYHSVSKFPISFGNG